MQLGALIQGLDLRLRAGSADTDVTALVDDSRKAAPGCAFIARAGAANPGVQAGDGATFIRDAVAKGASVVICRDDAAAAVPAGVTVVTGNTIDQALTCELAERFFDRPSRKLKLVGVTGTSGKTTTTFLVQHLLHQVGMKTGVIGTVVLDDGATRTPAELTTPGAIEFTGLLARMVANGCQAAVAEISSHALHQGRVAALRFAAGVLTNLTGDHLDYHGTMDAYAAAKAILFEMLPENGFAIVNADDNYAERMVRNTRATVISTTVTVGSASAAAAPAAPLFTSTISSRLPAPDSRFFCRATLIDVDPTGSRARFDGPWGSVDVKLPLVGKHNVQNTLQAVAAANAVSNGLGKVLRKALETLPQVPGRLERVSSAKSQVSGSQDLGSGTLDLKPTVLVDYAHKTDALENVLSALRPLIKGDGQLICVFGCGGDRDRTKRPKMAAAACRLADRVVVTSDNPRTEDPQAIIREVLAGVPADKLPSVVVEPDRAAAIRLAIASATAADTVLIAGKGHEDYQIIGKEKRHFDDREHAAEALASWTPPTPGKPNGNGGSGGHSGFAHPNRGGSLRASA